MSTCIAGISSMATRAVLAELTAAYDRRSGVDVRIESVGGVDAAKRVAAGEAFDVVLLASDAIDRLIASGHLVGGSKVDLVHSGVAIATKAGAPSPDIASEEALRRAVLAAQSIGYSTGPSGVQLLKQFDRWGISAQLAGRLVQAQAGVPVGALVARGEVELGFQQLSELINQDGITVLGPMPPAVQIDTTFSAACCKTSAQADAVRDLLQFLTSAEAAPAKLRHGMTPA
jgi:molybdate transport system substrate-binding protein